MPVILPLGQKVKSGREEPAGKLSVTLFNR